MLTENKNTNISNDNNNFHNINSFPSNDDNNNDNKLKAALYYAEKLHWKIFPCHTVDKEGNCSCGNPKCTSQGKHPHIFDWQQKATDNPKNIKNWWKKWPDANIGLATGLGSGVFVLDVDDGGIEYLEENDLNLNKDILKRSAMSKTGRVVGEGRHVFYRYDEYIIRKFGGEIKNRVKFLPGLDLRGKSGYVILPPSDHLSGNKYGWLLPPGKYAVEDPPEWLIIALKQPKRNTKIKKTLLPPNKKIQAGYDDFTIRNGERNNKIFDDARTLHGMRLPFGMVQDFCVRINNELCEEPLPDNELNNTVESAGGYVDRREILDQILDNLLIYKDETAVGVKHADLVKAILLGNKIINVLEKPGFAFYNPNSGLYEEMDKESSNLRLDELAIDILGEDHYFLWKTTLRNNYRALLRPKIRKISIEDLDSNINKICVKNGVIDLKTGNLLSFSPDYFLTQRCNVSYDEEAKCPRWEQFLEEIFSGDKELIRYIQKAVGFTLSGTMDEQLFFFLHGGGSNGKSVFLSVLSEILNNYAVSADIQTFLSLDKTHQRGSNDLAALVNKRFITTNETEYGNRFSMSRLKSWNSGEEINARFLYGEFFNFRPRGVIWISGNEKPRIYESNDGAWRRLKYIPFLESFNGEKRDNKLKSKLLKEKDGIFQWILEGLKAYQCEGLKDIDIVKANVEAYKREQLSTLGFFEDCCVLDPEEKAWNSELYANYESYCEGRGFNPLKLKRFTSEIFEIVRNENVEKKIVSKVVRWDGLRVKTNAEFEEEEELQKYTKTGVGW